MSFIGVAVDCQRGRLLLLTALVAVSCRDSPARAGETDTGSRFLEIARFDAPEAGQGVAVDDAYFYAIGNRRIGKYDKRTGERVGGWESTPELPLTHLNHGIVRDGKIYCASSNFPEYPEASSVEIFDAATLQHVGTHSFGYFEGSLTWVDWHDGAWWAVFAHYTEHVNDNPHAHDARWTSLVRFDAEWRRTGGWTFPAEVIEQFEPHSCSGGGWGTDGKLYVTGHDRGEVYQLQLPQAGAELCYLATLPAPIEGQAVAWDKATPGILYGIVRSKRQVVVMQLTEKDQHESQVTRIK